jgi:tetratricopeptide (TPR) repeat protein
MKDTPDLLDAEELMHLALEATDRSQNGQAMEYLKRLLGMQPDSAEAHYLLGAQQAQVGMFDRAIESMKKAIELKPGLEAARFQLGMLLATSTRVEEARAVWQPLDELGEDHPLRLFKTALLLLAEDKFEASIAHLQRGIALNQVNEPLNHDMTLVIERIRGDHPSDGEPAGAERSEEEVPTMFLNAYTGKVH